MSIKNKWRNVQMFGLQKTMPKRAFVMIGVFIAIIAVTFVMMQQGDEAGNILTGNVVATGDDALLTQEGQEGQNTNDEQSQEGIIEDDIETYEWYEYKEQCSFDIRQASDDVEDVQSYLDVDQAEYDRLHAEYKAKIEDLKREYEPAIERMEVKVEDAQANLARTEEILYALQEECAF